MPCQSQARTSSQLQHQPCRCLCRTVLYQWQWSLASILAAAKVQYLRPVAVGLCRVPSLSTPLVHNWQRTLYYLPYEDLLVLTYSCWWPNPAEPKEKKKLGVQASGLAKPLFLGSRPLWFCQLLQVFLAVCETELTSYDYG
jgi:hypothetical protein